MRLLHAVAFWKKIRLLVQARVITLKTQMHAVNGSWKWLSQLSFKLSMMYFKIFLFYFKRLLCIWNDIPSILRISKPYFLHLTMFLHPLLYNPLLNMFYVRICFFCIIQRTPSILESVMTLSIFKCQLKVRILWSDKFLFKQSLVMMGACANRWGMSKAD